MKIIILSLLALFIFSCSAGPNQTSREFVLDMQNSPAIDAQEWDGDSKANRGMRMPPEGTIPQGYTPYPYQTDPLRAGRVLKNPLSSKDIETLVRGQQRYEIFCAVCHGVDGKGNGPVAPKMALKPPALDTAKIKGWSDGRLYHVITAGQGVMGAYASQITNENDRWAIVSYIRKLQKAN